MKMTRLCAFVGLLGLGLASVGCSSSGGGSATGGTTGTGGKGGSPATGGSGGQGVDAAVLGCAMSDVPPSPLIAYSGADAGVLIMGGLFRYGDTPAPLYTEADGAVNVTDTVQVGAANHYQGFGIYFNGDSTGHDCIDATSYTGIQFDISGSLTGALCTMQFSINDSEHADSTVLKVKDDPAMGPNDPKASGPMGSYAPQLQIMMSQITSSSTTIKVPFSGAGAPTGGSPPDTALDVKKIEGVQWQMTTPLLGDGSATECALDITLKNVKFYK
jgi:hypothetical protein